MTNLEARITIETSLAKPWTERVATLTSQQYRAYKKNNENAFINVASSQQLSNYLRNVDQRLPLAGVSFAVKDNIITQDFPTTVGCQTLKAFTTNVDAKIVHQIKELGGALLGKTNMPELCQNMTGNNTVYSNVLNPLNHNWICGGSSSGSAAAVAAGLCNFSIGSDTGGSVRIPAALCGCVGFKPTAGRYSTDGFVPVSPSIDCPGIIANSAKDIALLDRLLIASSAHAVINFKEVRIGIPTTHFFDDLEPALQQEISAATDRLRDLGITLKPINLSEAISLNASVGLPIAFYEMLRELGFFLAQHECDVSLSQIVNGLRGEAEKQAVSTQLQQAISRSNYIGAIQQSLPQYIDLIDAAYARENVEFIIFPTTALTSVEQRPMGKDIYLNHNGKNLPMFPSYIRNTEPFSNYGGPCISLPIARTKVGKAVGLEIVAQRGQDKQLLALSEALEKTGIYID